MQSPTTLGDGSNHVNSDATTLSLPLHIPMAVQTYYETMCKHQPLARRNLIIEQLTLMRGYEREEKYEFVVARIRYLGGHDIGGRLECLVFERSLYSPIGSLSSSSAEHIVSQCKEKCFFSRGDRSLTDNIRRLKFHTSSDSNVRKICLLEELLRLIIIISNNSHLYSTDIDASFWFAATIMETAQAIFPVDHSDDDRFDKFGWSRLKRTLRRSDKPQSECGRQIVAAYRDDKKKHPIPTSTTRQSVVSNAASGNETETL
jgi:hypothetical protein